MKLRKFKILIEYECVAKSKTNMKGLLKDCPLGSTTCSSGEYIQPSKTKPVIKERGIIIL